MSIKTIEAHRRKARELKLSAPQEYWDLPIERLAPICNGYGPDRWPQVLRDILSFIYRTMPISSDIHDLRYELAGQPGAVDRDTADREMLANMQKEAAARYPLWKIWLLPARLAAMAKAKAAYKALAARGEPAWQAAIAKHQTQPSIQTFP